MWVIIKEKSTIKEKIISSSFQWKNALPSGAKVYWNNITCLCKQFIVVSITICVVMSLVVSIVVLCLVCSCLLSIVPCLLLSCAVSLTVHCVSVHFIVSDINGIHFFLSQTTSFLLFYICLNICPAQNMEIWTGGWST